MIICHEHRFIFVKTLKTAGTSVEIALSKYCGPEDVLTSFEVEEDDAAREALGYRGPQNYRIPLRRYGVRDYLSHVRTRHRVKFYHHASASFIRSHVSPRIWRSYFKFCFERNPWEKAVSGYFWDRYWSRGPATSDFSTWLNSGRAVEMLKGRKMYSVADRVIVDRIYRYEDLKEAMKDVTEQIGLPELPALPRAKSHIRKDKRHYSELMCERDLELVGRLYAWEIEHFGYQLERRAVSSESTSLIVRTP